MESFTEKTFIETQTPVIHPLSLNSESHPALSYVISMVFSERTLEKTEGFLSWVLDALPFVSVVGAGVDP